MKAKCENIQIQNTGIHSIAKVDFLACLLTQFRDSVWPHLITTVNINMDSRLQDTSQNARTNCCEEARWSCLNAIKTAQEPHFASCSESQILW